MQVAGPTFEEVLRKNFKRVLTYWSQIGTVMGLSAVGLGLISLYMYTRAIGRTDLFMASIDAKSALMIWLVIVLVLMSAFLFLLTVTTLLFWLSASLFHRTPGRLKDVVVWLTLPFLVGFLGYVVVIYYTSGWLPVGQSLLGLLVLFLLSCWGVLSRPAFKKVIEENLTPTRDKMDFLLVLLTCLLGTLCAALFPSLVTLNAYVSEVSSDSPHYVAALNLLILILTLLPVVIFYHKAGSLNKRILYSILSVALFALAFLFVLPGAMSKVTYKAAGGLDVRQDEIERFVLLDDLELHDLDPLMWNTRLTSQRHLEVQGFQLFSFGETLLICPKGLRNLRLNQMHTYTRHCLKTRNSAVSRKPPGPLYISQPACASLAPPATCWKPQGS